MSTGVRDWTEQLEVGELFDLNDVQRALPDKSRNAIRMSISRLCRDGDDPLVTRASAGFYTRRYTGEGPYVGIPSKALQDLPWKLAGPGAGLTGPYVINMLSWSTQVSPRLWIALVKRPPERKDLGVVFERRFNKKRLDLTRWEVSILEAVRCFDKWAEVPWAEAQAQFVDYCLRGYYDKTFRTDLLLEAAEAERGLGAEFMPRVQSLMEGVR